MILFYQQSALSSRPDQENLPKGGYIYMERIKQHLPGLALGLSEHGFGLFAGTAVKDTSSVTAAASAWDGMYLGHNVLGLM